MKQLNKIAVREVLKWLDQEGKLMHQRQRKSSHTNGTWWTVWVENAYKYMFETSYFDQYLGDANIPVIYFHFQALCRILQLEAKLGMTVWPVGVAADKTYATNSQEHSQVRRSQGEKSAHSMGRLCSCTMPLRRPQGLPLVLDINKAELVADWTETCCLMSCELVSSRCWCSWLRLCSMQQ